MPIRSMTGFGAAAVQGVRVEARSVNARFLEVKVRQPFGAEVDAKLQKRVKSRLGRGRVDVFVVVDAAVQAQAQQAAVDAALGELLEEVEAVRVRAASTGIEVSAPNSLELLDSSRRRAQSGRPDTPTELEPAIDDAVVALIAMREQEGAALERVLSTLVDELESQVDAVRKSMEGEGERLLERRKNALVELLGEVESKKVDADAVAREVALLLQRGDVREEVDRLESHFAQARAVLAGPASAGQGKRLDFLTQELLREVTTMGSKITAHLGSAQLIEAKAIIERMREQVQNVE